MTEASKKPSNKRKGWTNNPNGRPPLVIDLELVERLGEIHCTDHEIAAISGVSIETFMRRKREEGFGDMLEKARARGKASLRRTQWRLAENGNAACAIWLGKQLLGQRDKFDDPGEDRNPLPWTDD